MQASFVERKLARWLLRQTSGSGVRQVVSAFGAVASEIGTVRDHNEDQAVIVKCVDATGSSLVAALVADGIGGMRDGSRCAAIAIGAFVSQLVFSAKQARNDTNSWMMKSFAAANDAVYRDYAGQGGSTLVAVLVHEKGIVHWGSAGDSRLYRFSQDELKQVSVDDTIAGQLGKKGPLSPEHTKLLQFVGMGSDFSPHFNKEAWRPNDQYILTTDGVHYLSDNFETFQRVITHAEQIGQTTKRLIDLAKWCGGPDNATAAILKLPLDFLKVSGHEADSLSVWDAFGELQVQLLDDLEISQQGRSGSQQLSVNLAENETSETDFPKAEQHVHQEVNAAPKKQTKARNTQKTQRKKKKPQADDEKVQLDIKFSSKSD